LWEEELAILLGSNGAYRGEDVRRMTPEKRAWTMRKLREVADRPDHKGRSDAPSGPTLRGRPIPTR
jgi:hypothetical protein